MSAHTHAHSNSLSTSLAGRSVSSSSLADEPNGGGGSGGGGSSSGLGGADWVLGVEEISSRAYEHTKNVLRFAAAAGVVDPNQLVRLLDYLDQFLVPIVSREEMAEAALRRRSHSDSPSGQNEGGGPDGEGGGAGGGGGDDDDDDDDFNAEVAAAIMGGSPDLELGDVVMEAETSAAELAPGTTSVSSVFLRRARGGSGLSQGPKLSLDELAAVMEHPIHGVKVGNQRYHLRMYRDVFSVGSALRLLVGNAWVKSEAEALAALNKMVERGKIVAAHGSGRQHVITAKTTAPYRFAHHAVPLTVSAPKILPGTSSLQVSLLHLVYAVHDDRVLEWVQATTSADLRVAYPAVLAWARNNPDDIPELTARVRRVVAEDRALLLALMGYHRANGNRCLDHRASCSIELTEEEHATISLVDETPPGPAIARLAAAGRAVQHPFAPRVAAGVRLNKEFTSAARPAWISFLDEAGEVVAPDAVAKGGDDLRKDLAVQLIFQAASALWAAAPVVWRTGRAPHVATFKVQCTAPRGGYLEFVRGKTVKDITESGGWSQIDPKELAPSVVGGLVAAFVLGIRDRHSENVMVIRDESGNNPRLLHIDFGYMLMEAPGGLALDTPRLTLEPELIRVLKKAPGHNAEHSMLEDVQADMVRAFQVLRQQYPAFTSFCRTVLSPVYEPGRVEAHFWGRHVFHAGQTEVRTLRWFEEKVRSQLTESNLRRGAKAAIVRGYYGFKAMTATASS